MSGPGRQGPGRGTRNNHGHSQNQNIHNQIQSDVAALVTAMSSAADRPYSPRGLADIVNRFERLGQSNGEIVGTSPNVNSTNSSSNSNGNINTHFANSNGSTTTSRTCVTSPSSPSTYSTSTSGTTEDGRLSTFIPSHELSKLLECPVCYEITLPPVVMCTAGHNICSECRNKCTRCPVCRSGFCEARNRLAENIVDKCSIQCRYRSLGCSQVLGGRMMATHLDRECEFRPVVCRDCKVKIPYDHYINHLLNEERLPRQIATECSTGFDIEDDDFVQSAVGGPGQSWEPTWLHCYGLDFFCHLETLGNYWWIYIIGLAPVSVLNNYLCDILVWNRDKKQELRFHGPVHSYRKSGEEILNSGQCIITSQYAIRSILNQGGIDVVVCIFQVTDYQTPKSRNTGQPIFSPLILRGNNLSNVGGASGDSADLNTSANTTIASSPGSGARGVDNNNNNNERSVDSNPFDESFSVANRSVTPSSTLASPINNLNISMDTAAVSSDIQMLETIHESIPIIRSPGSNDEVDAGLNAGGDTEMREIFVENLFQQLRSPGFEPENIRLTLISSPTRSTTTAAAATGTGAATGISRFSSGTGIGWNNGRNRESRPQRESARVAAQARASRSLDGARRRRHNQRSHAHPQS